MRQPSPEAPADWSAIVHAALWVAASATAAIAVSWWFLEADDLVNVAMVFLFAAAVCAVRLGPRATFAAAVFLAALCDFLFVPPQYSFEVAQPRYLLTLAIIVVVSVVLSLFASALRGAVKLAEARVHRMQSLFELARELAQATNAAETGAAFAGRVRQEFSVDIAPPRSTAELARIAPPRATQLVDEHRSWLFRGEGLLEPPLFDAMARVTQVALERIEATESAREALTQAEVQETRNVLLSAVSHDLRTPLTVIQGSAQMLLELDASIDRDERGRLLARIASEAEDMGRSLNALMTMNMLDAGALKLDRNVVDLAEVVRLVCQRLAPRLGRRPLTLALDSAAAGVDCDEILMAHVIQNLLENICVHTPADAAVEVSLIQAGNEVQLCVRDGGPGIDPNAIAHAFEKFFRGPAQRRGTGLGLAIVRAIVELHGGQVELRNRQPTGLEVAIRLPVSSTPAAQERHDS